MDLSPADELAQIRAEMQKLQLRKTELECGFKRGELEVLGRYVQAEVQLEEKQVFVKELLPDAVLNDPQHWRTDFTDVVVLRPIVGVSPHKARQITCQTGSFTDKIAAQSRNSVDRAQAEIS
ncbi:hypothetical protein [Aestuariibius sp. HNIBRBA575]|uniref:hypothetical protein n=1 Tax=Aestuariibius sp. HNIBRBA575 TaxID=3233343 RepID=UPI0034A28B8C